MKVWQWLAALATMLAERLTRRRARRPDRGEPGPEQSAYTPRASAERSGGGEGRVVPAGAKERGAENVVLALLGLASLAAVGFIVVYAEFSTTALPNELLGVCLALALGCIGAALTVIAKRLVVTEELEEEYPQAHLEDQQELAEIVRESGSRFTRKKLLLGAGAASGGALALAAVTPAASLGPFLDTGPLDESPWKRGTRLVDESDHPYPAAEIVTGSYYTAFPEGADKELIGSPIVVVRLEPSEIHLPAGREGWAPGGILAYSKICTHAACAVALYRKPTFAAVQPKPALVCPCHYSTFDPATGASVTYGPAGRPLPQLPLTIDASGYLRAAGNFSERVGPSWWDVRRAPKR